APSDQIEPIVVPDEAVPRIELERLLVLATSVVAAPVGGEGQPEPASRPRVGRPERDDRIRLLQRLPGVTDRAVVPLEVRMREPGRRVLRERVPPERHRGLEDSRSLPGEPGESRD